MIHLMKITVVLLGIALFEMLLLTNLVSKKEIKPFKKLNNSSLYSYRPFRNTYTPEAFIKELDTSEWILNSYWIHPSSKSRFNMTTNDSLYHMISKNRSDLYRFHPSSGLIYKNDVKVGFIKKKRIDFGNLKYRNGEEIGTRYFTRFYIYQENDSLINGCFNINFGKNERLHITQLRTNNETKKEYLVKLIFYKN